MVVSGGGGLWGWLNVVSSPVSFTEAMIHSPIEERGYANAELGTTLDFVHVPGVVNVPGPDLELFDAQFDAGLYRVSTSYDGFAASILVDTAGGTDYGQRSYYYELSPSFADPANVVGVEIDLDDLGVPEGEAVIGFRLVCENQGCDPLTLARFERFALAVPPLVAGSSTTLECSGGTPSGLIGVAYSLAGNGPALVDTGLCGMMTVDLSPPLRVLTLGSAGSDGSLSFTGAVPAGATGAVVHLQALDAGSCTISNGVTRVVL